MASAKKTLEQVLRGTSDANVAFNDLRNLLLRLRFDERTAGSHHVFRRTGIPELINLQRDGNNAKPYQVKQVRQIILRHRLSEEL